MPSGHTPEPQDPHSAQSTGAHGAVPGHADPLAAVDEWLAAAAPREHPRRLALALLVAGWHPLEELVRRPALPRRTVAELLRAAGDDLHEDGEYYRISPGRRATYRDYFALPEQHLAPSTVDRDVILSDLSSDVAEADEHLDLLSEFIATAPAPKARLDHVSATPQTVLRRARWLREHYRLPAAPPARAATRLLFLGDHDLTSLAVALVEPGAQVTVVDVDEDILAHIDGIAAERGLDVQCRHADLRFGLPPSLVGQKDLVFADPPYTPDGMGLFAARATACLDENTDGRVLLAYGYSERQPALGWKVQHELTRLGLVFEAILPGFHRYHGAQAVGSAADLYVCQPTARAAKAARHRDPSATIYTHGPQSVEAASSSPESVGARLVEIAEENGLQADPPRAPGWHKPLTLPPGRAAVLDLRDDPGAWLARTLLGCTAERVVAVVERRHPDTADQRGRRALADLLRQRYTLRFRHGEPDSHSTVIVAEATRPESDDAATALLTHVLHRPHGKLGNTWREGLVAASGITKRHAREVVHARAPRVTELSARLIDLPRHRIDALLAAMTETARAESPS